MDAAALLVEVRRWWGLEAEVVATDLGGLNSRTWVLRVTTSEDVVAKLVAERDPFVAGLHAAGALAARGVRTGPAVPTMTGALAVETGSGWLALLRRERGRRLPVEDLATWRLWGRTMAELHRLLDEIDHDGALTEPVPTWPWTWLDPALPRLAADPELQQRIVAAVAAAETYADRTAAPASGLLYGDPNPQELLVDEDGVAVVDWGSLLRGPRLYDVASAWMFAGDRARFGAFRGSYEAVAGRVPDDGLEIFLRYRHAVQAWYFSWRIAHGDPEAPSELDLFGVARSREALMR